MVVRGVYPGRFQPLHWGHVSIVRWALERVDEVIVAIGTAQESLAQLFRVSIGLYRLIMMETLINTLDTVIYAEVPR
ncbi:MAG: adenylyltransferase/cytidyltransferase family protein [Ignisphaera sp.]